MNSTGTVCLHIPVALSVGGRTLHGELALPARVTEVRVCIARSRDRAAQRREAQECAKHEIAALNLSTRRSMTSGDLLRVIDWVRSRRLLRPLPISLMTPSADTRAALKAAHHRPASVSGVLVMNERASA